MSDIGPHDLVIERHIAATPEAVWRCWTEPELIAQWFAPAPGRVPEAEIEPVPGGRFRVVMESDDWGRMDGPPGCVLLAEPGRRFVWTSALGPLFRPAPDGEDLKFTADMTMRPDGEGCAYRIVARHGDAATAKRHEDMGFAQGWGMCAGQLAEVARGL